MYLSPSPFDDVVIMPNNVITSNLIKTISKGGRQIKVMFASETTNWRRTFLSSDVRENFVQALEKAEIPAGATKAIMAESEHPSPKDNYTHFTVVFQDENGNHLTTRHIYR
ncbi:hypothetical protein BST61_g7799 [Cercospora zeina]